MSTNNLEMMEALQALAVDKGISPEALLGALADALESAYKRTPGAQEYSWVTIAPDTFEIRVMAQELDEDAEPIGDEMDVTPSDFGRIAAQTAKQVMFQRIREIDRDMKYEEYAGREGDIVTGIIQQSDARYTLLDLGRVEALLPQAEQVPYERPEANTRVKAYIVEVRKTDKGPQIVVSRTHPGLIKRLFELEVPEIADGVVEIRACAREPGHRTKIAVYSNDQNVDPVGACVGARGARVRMVVNELRGEKIDIVPFSDDSPDFVMKALSPARVKEVRIDEQTGTAEVIVPDYQLSLAIGKEGQNARLAARLTGWRVDIKSETQLAEEEAYKTEEWAQGEWIVDPESGEQLWQPADGSDAISADQWSTISAEQGDEAEAGAPSEGSEPTDATDGDEAGDDTAAADEPDDDAIEPDDAGSDASAPADAAAGDTAGDDTAAADEPDDDVIEPDDAGSDASAPTAAAAGDTAGDDTAAADEPDDDVIEPDDAGSDASAPTDAAAGDIADSNDSEEGGEQEAAGSGSDGPADAVDAADGDSEDPDAGDE